MTDLNPDDKVLILGIPEPDFLREAAAKLKAGIIVAISDDTSVRAARLEFRELINVMFIPGSPEQIPWKDQFFTKVFDLRPSERADNVRLAAEIKRVLAIQPGERQGS